uniref:Uncharacterized protein n=1 Tax=Leptobrachium leishanense TaxID=445787 RepID=A0A8C5PVB3_9ANUR
MMNTDPVSERILDLTLEILYLLAGEDHMVVRRKSAECSVSCMCRDVSEGSSRIRSCSSVSAPRFPLRERHNEQKILELSNQIIRLLTGEVPIRCEDVTVYLSMEEWEYVERHKELYEDLMMENHRPLGSLDLSKPVISAAFQPCVSSPSPPGKERSHFKSSSGANLSEIHKLENTNTGEQCVCTASTKRENWNLPEIEPPARHAKDQELSSRVEEEPTPREGHFTDIKCAERVPTQCVTKEEPTSCEGGDLAEIPPATGHVNTVCVMEESTALTGPGIYPPAEHTSMDYRSVHIKQEPAPSGEESFLDRCPPTEYPLSSLGPFPSRGDRTAHSIDRVIDGSLASSDCRKCPWKNPGILNCMTTHLQEKPYSCSVCGRRFIQKSVLEIHQRTHTGEKPYSCPKCGKCFTRNSYLIQHQRTHTGEKPYSCTECGKCFRHKQNLNSHHKLHTVKTSYYCSECGKCFKQKSYLSKHSKIHKGEKPYSCSQCGKCFRHPTNLISHLKTHS